MTRNEKLKKLANAIKDFRGAYDASENKWVRPPQPHKGQAVLNWLQKLRVDVKTEWRKIISFKTRAEFDAWIKAI